MACVTLAVTIIKDEKVLQKNFIKVVPRSSTLGEVLRSSLQDSVGDVERIVASRIDVKNEFACDEQLTVHSLLELDQHIRQLTFHLRSPGTSTPCHTASTPPKNVFDVLMNTARSKYLPPKKDGNAKAVLYNDVLEEMETEEIGFPKTTPESDAAYAVNLITNALWYVDGNKHTIVDASLRKTVAALPDRFINKFNNYNDYKRKKQKTPSLSVETCKTHSEILFSLLAKPYTVAWGTFQQDLEQFAICLQSYSTFLSEANVKQKQRQSQPSPCRKLADDAFVEHRPRSVPIQDVYVTLDRVVKETPPYQAIFFEESIHVSQSLSKMQRHRFFKDLNLSVPVDLLRYDPGGGIGSLVFLWTVPENRLTDEILTSGARMLQALRPKIPQYHTRQMRAEFIHQYSNLGSKISPRILHSIYSNLALDSTADQHPAIDERLRQAIIGEDADLVYDLRKTNKGRPAGVFQEFFTILEKKVEAITAADERRHGVAHLSEYISIRDLREQTMKDCPEGTAIPTASTISFSFMPKNMYSETAKRYTGRIDLQHKVQSRQLRQNHVDTHYCAAVFRLMREMAVHLRSSTILLSIDDKAKVDLGEPGLAVSTGVRGKKTLVPSKTLLGALDHDLQSKASLTPSVVLNVEIPNDLTSSFYRGQVSVTLKDSIFQPSSAFRHAAELKNEIARTREKVRSSGEQEPSIVMIYSDGGPDHRLTFDSVKLSLIVLFKALNLDMLIAARTAPGNSWANPVERVMSLLNLGYQNCALARERGPDEFEALIKNCNTMDAIRKISQKHPEVRQHWADSLRPAMSLLDERTERLVLKEVPFCTQTPATEDDIDAMKSFIPIIDPNLNEGNLQKKETAKCQKFQRFLDIHCRSRNYTFQIRKCEDDDCCTAKTTSHKLDWLPDPMLDASGEHYKPFHEVYGTNTDDRQRPSLLGDVRKIAEEEQGCGSSLFTAQRVRAVVECSNCEKPRCVYGKRRLTDREVSGLNRLKRRYHYICGANITPEGDVLQGVVFTNIKMTCETPLEFSFYSSPFSRKLCAFCGSTEAEKDEDACKTHKVVLPLCVQCKLSGRVILKRQPIVGSKRLKTSDKEEKKHDA